MLVSTGLVFLIQQVQGLFLPEIPAPAALPQDDQEPSPTLSTELVFSWTQPTQSRS